MPRIELRQVCQRYGHTTVLAGIDLDIGAGQSVALLGPSGSGKSTLVQLLCNLLRPTSGRIVGGDTDLRTLDEAALTRWRAGAVALWEWCYRPSNCWSA